MKKLAEEQVRAKLIERPLKENELLYRSLERMGFFDMRSCTWIVNPFWSACGTAKVDPLQEYGMTFLNSPIAKFLGFKFTLIGPVPRDLMSVKDRKSYDVSLMKSILRRLHD